MKIPFLLVSLLLVPLASHAKPAKKVAAKTSKVVWRTDFDAALKEAKRARKPVFVDFYTDWCGPCKQLDATTFRDAKFVRASRQWVMVKINPEKSKRGAQLEQKYKLEGYPTSLMVDARGKRLNQIAGAYPTDMMLDEMQKALKQMGTVSARNPVARAVG